MAAIEKKKIWTLADFQRNIEKTKILTKTKLRSLYMAKIKKLCAVPNLHLVNP